MGRGQCDPGDSTPGGWRGWRAVASADDPTISATTGLSPTLESRKLFQCAQTDHGIHVDCPSSGPDGDRSRFESPGLRPPPLDEPDSSQMFSTEHLVYRNLNRRRRRK